MVRLERFLIVLFFERAVWLVVELLFWGTASVAYGV